MEIKIDFSDLNSIREAIDKYHTTETMLIGENDDGETVTISIFGDKVVLVTYQKNRWIRRNIYYYDGSSEELFEGKYDDGYMLH